MRIAGWLLIGGRQDNAPTKATFKGNHLPERWYKPLVVQVASLKKIHSLFVWFATSLRFTRPSSFRYVTYVIDLIGADRVTRTPDLRITNALLYQLSYVGTRKGGQYIQNPLFTQYRAEYLPIQLINLTHKKALFRFPESGT